MTGLSGVNAPPFSMEAEQSVIGGLMVNNILWDDVSEILSHADFYRNENRHIYQTMVGLAANNEPFDIITMGEYLQKMNMLEQAGGMEYIIEISENTPSISNLKAYAKIIHEHSILRKVIEAAGVMSSRAFNTGGSSADEVLEEAERAVLEISEQKAKEGGLEFVNQLADKALARIQELAQQKSDIIGIPSGFSELDKKTKGFKPGELIIVAARPAMGKSMWSMNVVEEAIEKQDKPVLVFSLEMPSEQLMNRSFSSLGRVDLGRVITGNLEDEDYQRIAVAVNKLKDRKLFIDDTPNLSPSDIRSRVRRKVREHGEIGMIMVDYLQLMQIRGYKEGRVNEISEISRSLKAIAKEFKCPVIALSQLNRSLEQRPNKRPIASDLRESGAIEQDADLILFIYRDEVYNTDSLYKGTAEIIIGKQRMGEMGTVYLGFQGQYSKFSNLSPDYEHPEYKEKKGRY